MHWNHDMENRPGYALLISPEHGERRQHLGHLQAVAVHLGSRNHQAPSLLDDPGPGNQDSARRRPEVVDLHLRRRAGLAERPVDAVAESRVGKGERDASVNDPGAVEMLVAHLEAHRRTVLVELDKLDADRLVKAVGCERQRPVSRIRVRHTRTNGSTDRPTGSGLNQPDVRNSRIKIRSAVAVVFLAVSPHCTEGVRREAWPRPPAGGGSVHASLDPRVGIKLIRPPQRFLPALNGSATVSRLQEARTVGSPPVHIVAAA